MDCREAQETILESFDQAASSDKERDLDVHLSVCAGCGHFARVQRMIDCHLAAAISVPRLSPGFRVAVKARIRRQEQTLWPDWLPDLAHLAGSVVAIGLSAVVLPFPLVATVTTGAGLAVVSYFLQTELVGSLAEPEEAGE